MENIEQVKLLTEKGIELAMDFGPRLVLAVLTLIIGFWIIRLIVRALRRTFDKRDFDPSLETFLVSLSGITLKVLLLLSVASMVGVEVTSFIAILGAAGLAVGMALSDSLKNFAGGVMLLVFKPFTVGDFIEAQGFSGTVTEVQIFNTILKTPDNKTVIIPNSPLSSNAMVNYSSEARRRVDFTFGIGYEDDIDKARSVLLRVIGTFSQIYPDPKPFVQVGELADSSVNLVVRVWADSDDYWDVHFGMTEAVKKEFDKEGISIPFPQRDVHLHKVENC